ncbi:MAG TPA: sigma-70 family RNA polymerase sigma factor [Solirubrobacterales bacterium]
MSEVAAPAGFHRLLSDERLTRRAVRGDERAFGAIFRRYHQPLYRYCLTIVGTPEDAQDALQNTMMKVLRALPGEDRKIELKPWLYRIAHNESIDLLRRRKETRELDAEQPALGHGLAEDAATRERLQRLLVDLRELPERQREVLVMREMGGLDFEEIATALGTSGAVARQTLYEARQSLRQMEEGREMNCDVVTRALSDGDGRVVRRRDVRAHLRTCASCRSFREEIERRERSFAALSPLPAVAAAGMLQGLLGSSQAAGGGGGLAALLGGGAAKTVGASAAAKGVATVAVVAAVGVTAADRSGVIHLGLPGDGGTQSSTPQPGAGGAAPAADSGVGQNHAAGRSQGGKDDRKRAQGGGLHGSGAPAKGTPPATKAVGAPAAGGHGFESHPRSPQADAKAQGPQPEHAGGKGHEGQHPSAATQGQETAAEQQPQPPGSNAAGDDDAGDGNGKGSGQGNGNAPVNTPKSAPEGAPSSPSQGKGSAPASPSQGKGSPSNPPAAKPESPPQSQAPPKAEPSTPAAPSVGTEKGKGTEKSAEAGKKA